MNNLTKKIILHCAFLGLSLGPMMASSESLKPLEKYHADYEQKWTTIVSQLEANQEMTKAQKIVFFDKKMRAMEQVFKKQRLLDYQQLEVTETIEQTCRRKTPRAKIGRAQACAKKCVERPNENMYTSQNLVKFEGPIRKESVTNSKACFTLATWGAGAKSGSVTATFKYRDAYIDNAIEQDTKTLFSTILEIN